MSGLDPVQDGYDLAFGKLPGLPPERGVAAASLHRLVEEVQELRQAGVQGHAAATRAGPEFAAEPGLLIEGVYEDVIHLGEAAHEVSQ